MALLKDFKFKDHSSGSQSLDFVESFQNVSDIKGILSTMALLKDFKFKDHSSGSQSLDFVALLEISKKHLQDHVSSCFVTWISISDFLSAICKTSCLNNLII